MANSKRKCKGCNRYLRQDKHDWRNSPVGWFHDVDCQIKFARKQVKAGHKQRKRERTRKRQELNKPHYIKITRLVAQEYAALRDHKKPCVSCGKYFNEFIGSYLTRFDGGHYKSVGARIDMQLNLNNIHGQCRKCNSYDSGKSKEFEQGLIQRYGQAFTDRLNNHPRIDTKQWDIAYLERYRRVIRKRMKRFKHNKHRLMKI